MQCVNPFMLKEGENFIPCPCGKCLPCLKRRVSGWSFRLRQQDKVAEKSMFITLTYDTKYVPITNKGFMTLCKRDVQLFLKRLRKAHNGPAIKYYSVGEYGGKTMRPHYHLIIFNCNETEVSNAWRLGEIHFGTVSGASVGYVLKYMVKPSKIPLHKNDDRTPEFSHMSKGLGMNYLTPAMRKYHMDDLVGRTCIIMEDGVKISMPRYYKEKLYSKSDKAIIQEYHEANGGVNPVLLMDMNARIDLINQLKGKVERLAAERKTI